MEKALSDQLTMDQVLFFMVRHGETAGNKKKIYRGWSNAPEAQLDAAGKKGAQGAGSYISGLGAPVQYIITDSLDRVVETCELIACSFPDAKMELVRALHPLNMGEWTLKSKDKHPIQPYLDSPDLRIPGGETVHEFDRRQERIFGLVFEIARGMKGGKVVVGVHGSNVSYVYNHIYSKGVEKIGYEGLVDPGGVIAVTEDAMVPLLNVRGPGWEKKSAGVSFETKGSGTPTIGFVTWLDNKGPRQCDHCEYAVGGACGEEHVKAKAGEVLVAYPKMIDGSARKIDDNGRVAVDGTDCCNFYEPGDGR